MHVRRAHHLFPIRPYLTLLVGNLEDMDGNVRECARQSVVELFTGPAITDAARSDLKKELEKKGVRKAIVEGVLSQIVAGGGPASSTLNEGGSENTDGGRGAGTSAPYVPPSLALMNKRPGVSGNGIPKSSSQGSIGGSSRPASRAAVLSPIPPDGAPPAGGGGSEVKPVYVRYHSLPFRTLILIYCDMTDRVEPGSGERVCFHAKAL